MPALSLRLGSSDAGQDPASSTTRKAYDLLAKGFGPGFNGTFQIVARTPNGKADLPKVQQLADALEQDGRPGRGRARRCRRPNGKIALIEARPVDRAAGRGDQRPDRHAARRRRSRRPSGGLARLRRRHHRDLRRLRRRADRQAAAVHRGDRAARLPAADDRVPQPADPAHRGGDEPARGRRRVRRRHRWSSRRASSPGRSASAPGRSRRSCR